MDPIIQCSDLFHRLGDDEVLVVDCRSDQDWERIEKHIPGALRITPAEMAEVVDSLPHDELIVLCGCAPDGADIRGALKLLKLRGRSAVCLNGGLHAWVKEGYPTEHHLGCVPASVALTH